MIPYIDDANKLVQRFGGIIVQYPIMLLDVDILWQPILFHL